MRSISHSRCMAVQMISKYDPQNVIGAWAKPTELRAAGISEGMGVNFLQKSETNSLPKDV